MMGTANDVPRCEQFVEHDASQKCLLFFSDPTYTGGMRERQVLRYGRGAPVSAPAGASSGGYRIALWRTA